VWIVFEEPCFVVEDKPGLMEEYGNDPKNEQWSNFSKA